MSQIDELLEMVTDNANMNPLDYIKKAIRFYNHFKSGSESANRVGHPISQELSDKITRNQSVSNDGIKAIFFSFANIFETIESLGDHFVPDSGLAVVFGRYPDDVSGVFQTEFEAQNLNPMDFAGKKTVVLKYVSHLNANLSGTEYYTKNDADQRESDVPLQYVTNMGVACPRNCPPGT